MAGSEDLEQGLIRDVEGRIAGRLSRQQEEILRVQGQISEMLTGLAERMTAEPDGDLAVVLSEHLRRAREHGHREAAQSSRPARETSDMALLKAAVEDIDHQRTQADILNTLVNRAASFAPRVAFFVVKNERATGWRARGLEGTVGDDSVREISLPLAADTVLGRVHSSRETWSGAPGANADDHELTGKLGDEPPQRMVAVPLIAREKCVAVLYADSAGLEGEAINLEALETLVRVTGMSVELLATKRPAPSGSPASSSAATPTSSPSASSSPTSSSSASSFAATPAPGASHGASTAPQPAEEEKTRSPAEAAPTEGRAADQSAATETAPRAPEVEAAQVEPAAGWPSGFGDSDTEVARGGETGAAAEGFSGPAPEAPVGVAAPEASKAPVAETAPVGGGAAAGFEVSAEAREERGIVPLVTPEAPPPAPAAAAASSHAAPLGERRRFGQADSELPVEVSDEERRYHQDARRFARLLVSEIKLYNEPKVNEGRERGDLYERLRDTIDRSRQMYDKRVHPSVAPRYDYFHHELVNTLAEGDTSKLGAGYPGATVSA